MKIQDLEPKLLWDHFSALNAVPRPSKKEERVRQFMVDFGNSLQLETVVDKIGNVIIKKPASPGMEERKTVILQSHLDMVHQKNSDTVFDFDQQGIEMYVDGDWVKAKGTTLGADNGIGVAAIMAVLSSENIKHPAIEAFFTIDEETGMTGAMHMDGSLFNGEILLNIDTEDDDELSIGCAGGIDTNTKYNYEQVDFPKDTISLEIHLKGLLGGHSGMDIDKGRGNANKLIARLLHLTNQKVKVHLVSIDGGGLRNAIPREAKAIIRIHQDSYEVFQKCFQEINTVFTEEYAVVEPSMHLSFEKIADSNKIVKESDCEKILNVLCSVHNGVYRMSPDIVGLVEASSSLARVIVKDGQFFTQSLQRSSVESTKEEVRNAVGLSFSNIGAEVEHRGDYPGWKPNPDSEILKLMEQLYRKMFQEEPQVKACHAGLECGILGKHLPGVDMISFGPNIRAAHSPDEKVQISSVQKFWDFYLQTLELTPMNQH